MYYADDNTSGRETYNTAVGYEALKGSTTASANTGQWNTAVGDQSLNANTSGNGNTSVGNVSLFSNTTGTSNTALGGNALNANISGNENVAIGVWTMDHVIGGSDNTGVGKAALAATTSGSFNVGLGMNAGNVNTIGTNNTFIGAGADASSNNLSNATAIGNGAVVNASNKIVMGNASATTVGGYGSWTNYSDRRLKENIVYQNDLGLSFIQNLKTASYNYINDKNKVRRDGLIAQDVQEALTKLGIPFSGLVIDADEMQTMNLSYDSFVIPLINAVKEQQQMIDSQQKIINKQQQTLDQLLLMQNKLIDRIKILETHP